MIADGCQPSAYEGYSLMDYFYPGLYTCNTGDCIAIPCNDKTECKDGSDEEPELCGKG